MTTPQGQGSSTAEPQKSADQQLLDALVDQAKTGSSAALDQLIERLSKHLWDDLNGRRRRSPGASRGSSDLVQETLMRARDRFAQFERATYAEFKSWAEGIRYRRRQEWFRNRQSRNEDRHKWAIWSALRARAAGDTATANHESAIAEREQAERAYATYQKMDDYDQFIIELRLLNGLTYKQIAELTGTTEDACRKAFNRAIERLRRGFLGDEPQ
jgi:RNA polymerase sigma factor (sigma-70 family)